MQLSSIDYSSRKWESLPTAVRSEVRLWLEYFKAAPTRGVKKWLEEIAANMGVGYSTARTKYYALKRSRGDWTVLLDGRSVETSTVGIDGTASPAFRAELLRLVEKNQRKNAPAFRALRNRWLARQVAIPGYESWEGWPKIPTGWHPRNLARIVKAETNRARMQSVRIGTSSKTNPFLPTVHTTRVGLWPGAVIQFDDQWHDNFVTLGKRRELVRVIELGALDLFSGDRFRWGAKPRRKTATGSFENIRTRDMRLFAAGMLHTNGISANGSMWMLEHGTAAIEESIERILYDATGGLLRIERQPIEGKQAALNGFWSGSEGGNFRAKASLESTHNFIRNDMAFIAGQTGKDKNNRPVTTDRQLAYINRVVADVFKKVPHRADLLKLPLWDFHTQLIPWLTDYYEFGLAMRTDHNLEGWERLGHVIREYTALPGSGQWMNETEFLSLPEESQMIIGNAAKLSPEKWTNRRNLSPREVWNRRTDFRFVPQALLCEMLTEELAREVTCQRGFLEFCDLELSPDELIYTGRFISGPRKRQEIPHGEKVLLFANPFDDGIAFIVDGKGCYQGEVPLYKRILPINVDAFHTSQPWESRPDIRSKALKVAAGEKHERIADILQPLRILHAEEVREARDLRDHNKRVISGAPVTDDELAAARSDAAHKAATTRTVKQWGSEISEADCNAVADALQTPTASEPPISNEQISNWLED